MIFLGALALAIVFAFACRRPLKAAPWAFYGLALLLDVLFVVDATVRMPGFLHDGLYLLVHKCTLATALFAVVMYIGVFRHEGWVSQQLRPVRAELSILAWLLSLGHVALYVGSYVTRLASGIAQPAVALSLAVALVLLVLLVLLGVTSFNVVKRRMSKSQWRRVQWWAYPFFGLVYVHLMLMLAPAALHGGLTAQTSVVVYTVVFGVYAVARIARALADRRVAQGAAECSAVAVPMADELEESALSA